MILERPGQQHVHRMEVLPRGQVLRVVVFVEADVVVRALQDDIGANVPVETRARYPTVGPKRDGR